MYQTEAAWLNRLLSFDGLNEMVMRSLRFTAVCARERFIVLTSRSWTSSISLCDRDQSIILILP
jgi:hypothetical protein